jgi:hypothetical protein
MVLVVVTTVHGDQDTGDEVYQHDANSSAPRLPSPGGSPLTTNRSRPLTVGGSASLPPCTNSTPIIYTWSLTDTTTPNASALTSTSANPRTFKLPPRSLTAGHSYVLRLTATVPASGRNASAKVAPLAGR